MSISPASYFETLIGNAKLDPQTWRLISERIGDDVSRQAKLRATLEYFGVPEKFESIDAAHKQTPTRTDLSPGIKGVLDQLRDDLVDYITAADLVQLERTYFGSLPISGVDAFCIDQTFQGRALDGFLVILNEGLYICTQVLAKAFVLENLQGDLAQYRQSGKRSQAIAIRHFLKPHASTAKEVFFNDVPPEIEGALAASQSAMAIVILQFVCLHEFGHIVHRDFNLMDRYRFHFGKIERNPHALEHQGDSAERSDGILIAPVTDPSHQYWTVEFAADLYALKAICSNSRSNISRWANFISIYIFLKWFEDVEAANGSSLCPFHPPPEHRAQRLLAWMTENVPRDQEIDGYLASTVQILNRWKLPKEES